MAQTIDYASQQLGDIVVEDFRTAEVFKSFGLDFCCGGRKSLSDACAEKSIPVDNVIAKLDTLQYQPTVGGRNYNEWALDFLADYIVNTHHHYVDKTMPDLDFYTKKIANVHGHNHPELVQVADLFQQVNDELTQHMKHEEEVLFPAIKDAFKTQSAASKKIIAEEMERVLGEHDFAGQAMEKINIITGGYAVPGDACNTYMVSLKLLEQFENDLHTHIHLENNILFLKALKL